MSADANYTNRYDAITQGFAASKAFEKLDKWLKQRIVDIVGESVTLIWSGSCWTVIIKR